MTFRKLIRRLHLWLGLASGLVIIVVCVNAAIWAFSPEIENWTQGYRHIKEENKSFLPVSTLRSIANGQFPGKVVNRISFEGRKKSATADFYGEDYYYTAFINPYNGTILKLKDNDKAFFNVVLVGHYTLWLGETGGLIVKWATLIFLIMLVTGIVLWWPRNRAAKHQRFKIKFRTSPKRLNYDLHNVLGFYASWVILFATLTGLVWTFEWVANAEWWIGSGGKNKAEYPNPVAARNSNSIALYSGIDSIFSRKLIEHKDPFMISVSFPIDDSSAYNISVYPHKRFYDSDDFFYNQYTMEEINVNAFGKYADANGGEKLSRMNYDIHIGNILGLPGRIAMFLAVLITASLPVTGFYIWWGRNKKEKRNIPVPV